MEPNRKAFVLLSGGLDSTTCLHKAIFDFSEDTPEDTSKRVQHNQREWIHIRNPMDHHMDPITWVEAISIDYGQRHYKEMNYARATCNSLGIKHTVLDLKGILGGAMLTDKSIEIPDVSYADLPHGVSPTYVPYRNGTLLALITAHAQKWVNDLPSPEPLEPNEVNPTKREAGVYFGAHSEDAQNWAYPDCTPEFIGAQANAIYIGSYRAIRLYTPLQWLMKHEIVTLGHKLGVDFSNTWSCYKGENYHCGVCPTCRSRKDAFKIAKIADPTEYAQ